MKDFGKDAVAALLLTLLLPGLLFNTVKLLKEYSEDTVSQPTEPTEEQLEKETSQIRVLMEDGSVATMDLEEYLVGVVMGEMPESFELEALKAQAVVARTYTLKMRESSGKHPDADVCVQSGCCQSYRTGETERIEAAVNATAGQVLTYQGKLIDATYFSSSGGRTEDAVAVWGSDVPYLQATDSPGEEIEPVSVILTAEEFCNSLGIAPEGPCETWISEVTYTDGGGVDTMVIGGQRFKGTELRSLLGLRSTAFVMTAVGDHISVTTRGYGHRVGMSQYGAEAMAAAGAGYEEILLHYYQGVTLELLVDKDLGIS